MNRTRQVLKYVISDFVSASLAWTMLYLFRKFRLEEADFSHAFLSQLGDRYFLGLLLIPLLWLFLYAVMGMYKDIFRRHRLKEVSQTFVVTIIGVIVIFFTVILDDQITNYTQYYYSLGVLFICHFLLTLIPRLVITTLTVKRIHSRKIGFNTIIVGGNERALGLYDEIAAMRNSPGFNFVGFVRVNGRDDLLTKHIPLLGKYNELPEIIERKRVEEVILAIESSDHKEIGAILNQLEGTGVNVKIIPDVYDILSGMVRMSSIFGLPLIAISRNIMPQWQFSMKRIFDLIFSFCALLILMPVYATIAVLIKLNSKGPVFFTQERIGKYGNPFNIYKFRTMRVDAEREGPQLSSKTDSRITSVGRFLRKTRLDEIPQFINVLKGDMALVGPRPERQFFIDQIMERAPHYRHLHKVKPGITSWGQVKYGYAENVEQMISRLKYDVIYIENMSLAVDLKILLYTVLIVVRGDGK